MILDSRTLVVVLLLLAIILGAAHFMTWHINRSIPALRHCAMGDGFSAIGLLTVALRGPEPAAWTLMLTNAAIAGVYVSLFLATRSFTTRRMPVWPVAALVTAYLLTAGVFIYYVADVGARVAAGAAFIAVMSTLCGGDLLRSARWSARTPVGVVGFILIAHAVFNAARAAFSLVESPLPNLLAPSTVQTLAFLESSIAILVIGIGFIIMTTERLQAELRQAATYDTLTGIFNRRAFLALAEAAFARNRRSGKEFALLLIDIDHFKRINDSFGHQAGDEVLRAFAGAVTSELRQSDVFGRYGGEEFCVLLPDTRLDGALVVAERLRMSLRDLVVEHEGNLISTSISIGVADTESGAASFDDILSEADRALYRAKATGRDRVVGATVAEAA
ncbi:MAG TPA: GGDEF domain-containing protein [Azospirillum sp.]